MNLRLDKKLPVSLRNEFWVQLIKAVEDEIVSMRNEFSRKKFIYSISYSEKQDLLDLAETLYGVPFSSYQSLSNSLKEKYGFTEERIIYLLRKELYKISFNILNKGTLFSYQSFFKTFGYSFPFQIFVYSTIPETFDPVTGNPLIRRNLLPFLRNINDFIEAYTYVDDEETQVGDITGILGYYGATALLSQDSDNNFSGMLESSTSPTLDHSDEYTLDDDLSPIKMLDYEDVEPIRGTKHVGFEIVILDKFKKNGNFTLFPYEVVQYMKDNIFFYRRACEIPHIGAQYSVFIDKTGYWDINAKEDVQDNVISNYNFERDAFWIKQEKWSIANGYASREPGSPPSDIYYPMTGIKNGDMLRVTIHVDSIGGDATIVDGDNVVKTTFTKSGEVIFDIPWTTDSKGISIRSSNSIVISYFTAQTANKFSSPETMMKSAIDLNASSEGIDSITGFAFGYGSKYLPSQNDEVYSFPTELEHQLAYIEPLEDEKFFDSNPDYIGAIVKYDGQFFNNIPLHDDTGFVSSETGSGTFGTDKTFTGFIPSDLVTIKSNTPVFVLKNDGDVIDYIIDNGVGELLGKNRKMKGNINYTTGEYSLSSNFITSNTENYGDMEVASSSFTESTSYVVLPDSGVLLFEYEGTQYFIGVDSSSNLTSNFPYFNGSTSSFTYGTIQSSFIFNFTQLVILTNMRFIYEYKEDTLYDANCTLDFYRGFTNKPYSITEIGVYGTTLVDSNPRLIAYITCAPIELYSNIFHLNMGVILEK